MKNLRDQTAVFQLLLLISVMCLLTAGAATASQPKHAPPTNTESSEHGASPSAQQDPHNTPAAHQEADAHHGHGHENLGKFLPLWSCIPFACILLSIALFPLLLPDFWHHHFGKISGFWSLTLAIPFIIAFRGAACSKSCRFRIWHITFVPGN